MKPRSRLLLALFAGLLWPMSAPAAEPAGRKAEPTAQAKEKTAKKNYSRGIKSLASPATAPAPATGPRWDTSVGMDSQIFPSYVVSTATMRLPQEDDVEDDPRVLGEALGLIGVWMEDVPSGSALKVEIKANAVMDNSTFQGRASAGAGDYEIYPKINYKFDALLGWRQPMPLNIVMEVFVDGRSLGTQSATVTVRSINDCPLVITAEEGSDEEDLDLSWMFAAYVNENHPFVDTLTREAIDSKVVDAFTAYQDDRPDEVFRQVYAIWHTLQQRGIHYSDISQSSAESPIVFSQHVRLFDEALAAKQANCVDGTALFAAVLRKIGIAPYLALVPGHMFLAFDLDPEGKTTIGLETTMMGSAPPDTAKSKQIPASLTNRFRDEASFKTFSAAIAEGTRQLKGARKKMDGDDPEYQLISLSEAREIGILPLAYIKPTAPPRSH